MRAYFFTCSALMTMGGLGMLRELDARAPKARVKDLGDLKPLCRNSNLRDGDEVAVDKLGRVYLFLRNARRLEPELLTTEDLDDGPRPATVALAHAKIIHEPDSEAEFLHYRRPDGDLIVRGANPGEYFVWLVGRTPPPADATKSARSAKRSFA